MIYQIGMMQGRLSPSRQRLQSFPWETWQVEFERAHTLGFDTIEWLYDSEDAQKNPLCSSDGRNQIRRQIADNNVRVRSLCANYFVAYPFVRVTAAERREQSRTLRQLITDAAKIGIQQLVLPVLENSQIKTRDDADKLLQALASPLETAAKKNVTLAIETELPAATSIEWVTRVDHPYLKICYDTGNAAANGYDVVAEIKQLAAYLSHIHLKDRKRGGPNVLLGAGDVPFGDFFRALTETPFRGMLVLETTPGDDYHAFAQHNVQFVRNQLRRLNLNS